MAKIYVIEDDETLRTELASLLALQGFEVGMCEDFEQAVALALEARPDCVLLDLKLPNADGATSGHSICRELKARGGPPVIILTSVSTEFDEVMALGLGASDYILKPYRPAVLIARIKALLQREDTEAATRGDAPDPRDARIIEHGGLTLDLGSSSAEYRGSSALLTRNESRILALLLANPGTIISRHELMCDLWESDAFVDDNTLTVNINRLRRTLSDIGVPEDFLRTRRGQGYVI